MPENFYLGGGAAETTMHPAVMIAMIVVIAFIWFAPRKVVIVPLLLGVFLIPQGQVVVVGGMHFMAPRLFALCGCLRLAFLKLSSSTDLFLGGRNAIDGAFSLWAVSRATAFVLLWMSTQALINQAGFLISTLGMYCFLRFLVQEDDDIITAIQVFSILVAINALEMVNEQMTHRNLFGLLGGVQSIPNMRDGIRSQGVFQHAVLAGSFGAILLPLFFWLWRSGKSRIAGMIGIVSSSVMVVTSHSSTPVMAYLATVLGLCLWPLRRQMRPIRWAIVLTLVALHLVMKAPVWFLIARVDISSGSGYHRAELIDTCIRHFAGWWLIGTKDASTWGLEMWDNANQFVAEAQSGGLATLIFFVAILSRGFRAVGLARIKVRGDRKQEWSFWLLGIALFATIVSFFGVSYFDQTEVAWLALLAIISAATAAKGDQSASPAREPASDFLNTDTDYETFPIEQNVAWR